MGNVYFEFFFVRLLIILSYVGEAKWLFIYAHTHICIYTHIHTHMRIHVYNNQIRLSIFKAFIPILLPRKELIFIYLETRC